jgi:carbon catabolite-derepressing protein kinase
LAVNPFEAEFDEEDEEEEEEEDGLDFELPPHGEAEVNTFAVLNSSLPLPKQLPEPHHLASYANAKQRSSTKDKHSHHHHRTKWHFGIRSRSPPMEVVLEIYRTLKALGMEWKEKMDLGGLGGVRDDRERERGGKIERNSKLDGHGTVDLKLASDIYFVETRARVHDVVVRISFPCIFTFTPCSHLRTGVDESAALHGGFDQLLG